MSNSKQTDQEKPEFEDALKQLSQIVEKLESEEVGLEEAISLFEKGSKLSRHCAGILEEAELKIENVNEEKDKD